MPANNVEELGQRIAAKLAHIVAAGVDANMTIQVRNGCILPVLCNYGADKPAVHDSGGISFYIEQQNRGYSGAGYAQH